MKIETTIPPGLEATVAALMDIGAQLSQIVGHMAGYSADRVALPGGQEGMRAPDSLRTLLTETVAQAAELPDHATLAVCASLLREIERVIGREIYLVPPEGASGACRSSVSPRRRR